MSIKTRIYILAASLLLIMVLLGGSSIFLLQTSNVAFETTYKDRVIPLRQLKIVADMFAVNVVDTIHKTNAGAISITEGATSIQTAETEFKKQWDAYSATQLTDDETKLQQLASSQISQALSVANEAMRLMQTSDRPGLQQLAHARLYPAVDPLSGTISKLIDLQLIEAEKNYVQSQNNLRTSIAFSIGSLLIALLIGFSMAWRLAARLGNSVRELSSTCQSISQNHDLTLRIPNKGSDELSIIANELNHLLDSMSNIIREVRTSSQEINTMARGIGDASSNISGSSTEQSKATTSIASTVEQFAVSITLIAENADVARQRATQANQVSSHSASVIHETLNEINAIGQAIRTSEQQVDALTRQSHEIVAILDVIRDVADQTNLLALNAAIEAARAGEMGRGFAVVADEVRKLAERTAQSTVQIEQIIKLISQSAQSANHAMQETVSRVGRGEALTVNVQEAISSIQLTMQEVSGSASEIANALAEQRTASQAMAKKVEHIAQLSESNAGNANELNTFVGTLEHKAEQLESQVKSFSV